MKRDLLFSKPYMNAAGSLGFAPDTRLGIPLDSFGAFVTNPISLRPRLPAAQPAVIEYPGGFLLHTGLPNPGIRTALKNYSAKWTRSELPIIVHLMADRPEETQRMVRLLESHENVMAVELGFAPLLADDIILLTLEMCLGEIPLIFSLPIEQVLSLGPRLMQEGAQAISIAALERQFWACDHAATNGLVDLGTAVACVAATEQLKQRRFNGDFAAMLAWWQSNKTAEHFALDTAHRNAIAQARPAGPR